jgi:hypothetical protein
MAEVPLTQKARQQAVFAAAAQVHPEIRAAIAKEAIESQKSVVAFPMYSKVRVRTIRTGADPFTYTVADQLPKKAFNYKYGDLGDGAGFAPGTLMTLAETNLTSASQTRNNADTVIWGVAIELGPLSDPLITQLVFDNCEVEMTLNGTDSNPLGRLAFFPGAAGLYGQGVSKLAVPPIPNTNDTPQGFITNGNPQAGNFYRFPHPLRWNAIGSGKKDTSLVISVIPTRSFSYTTQQATRAAAAGVAGWTPPADQAQGTYCDLIFRLISVQISQRSENM